MQTLEGEEAKQITRQEFEDLMKQVGIKVKEKLRAKGAHWQPLWSWDHVSLHEGIDWHRVGLTANQRVPLGVRAPDMHKPIEHVFAFLKRALHYELYKGSYQLTPQWLSRSSGRFSTMSSKQKVWLLMLHLSHMFTSWYLPPATKQCASLMVLGSVALGATGPQRLTGDHVVLAWVDGLCCGLL